MSTSTTPNSRTDHYLFTTEHQMLRESIRGWVEQRIEPNIDRWEQERAFPRELFEELGELGFLGLQYPEEYGGQGGDFAANLILCEELSRVGAESVCMSVAVHTGMATPPILKYGTEEQRRRYLPGLIAGEKIAALGISEPDAGSDVAGIKTTARRTNGAGWILEGGKTFITNGGRADVLLVIARTASEGQSRRAFSLFLVDASLPGFSRGRQLEKLGRHASDTCELRFDSILLAPDALLGEEGRGFHQLMWELDAERLVAAATSVALGFHALRLAVDYVKQRHQFGKPLADFQALRHNLATKQARLTAARELVYTTARRFQSGEERLPEVAMAKLLAAEALNEAADYALQLHGGYGYMVDYPISRVWLDARVKRITAGTDEIQREIIARHLLGRPSA
jgi:alkylation response protein AidB-like acyl-CoA dehydrogenase